MMFTNPQLDSGILWRVIAKRYLVRLSKPIFENPHRGFLGQLVSTSGAGVQLNGLLPNSRPVAEILR